jgi:hypothetical protein
MAAACGVSGIGARGAGATGPAPFAAGISRIEAALSFAVEPGGGLATRAARCGRSAGSEGCSAGGAVVASAAVPGCVGAVVAGGVGWAAWAAAASCAFRACGAGVSGPGAALSLPSLSPDRIASLAPYTCMPPGFAGLTFTGRLSASITGTP